MANDAPDEVPPPGAALVTDINATDGLVTSAARTVIVRCPVETLNVVVRGEPFHSATDAGLFRKPCPVMSILNIALPAVMLSGKMLVMIGVGFGALLLLLLQLTSEVAIAVRNMSEPQRKRINPILPFLSQGSRNHLLPAAGRAERLRQDHSLKVPLQSNHGLIASWRTARQLGFRDAAIGWFPQNARESRQIRLLDRKIQIDVTARTGRASTCTCRAPILLTRMRSSGTVTSASNSIRKPRSILSVRQCRGTMAMSSAIRRTRSTRLPASAAIMRKFIMRACNPRRCSTLPRTTRQPRRSSAEKTAVAIRPEPTAIPMLATMNIVAALVIPMIAPRSRITTPA